MNNSESVQHDSEIPIYDAVRDLSRDDLERTVRRNAAIRHFPLTGEHLNVIHTLVEHYKADCASRDCLAAHEQMRFLETTYASLGGSRYLYMLFDALPDTRGVLAPIHELAGLPRLRLEADKGFGTAY